MNAIGDDSAKTFIGAKSVQAIQARFMAHPRQSQLDTGWLKPKAERFWIVRDLCAVFDIQHNAAIAKMHNLIKTGRIRSILLR